LFCLGLLACSTSPTLPDEPLQDRYWRVVEIDGKAVQAAANKSEPHVVLASDSEHMVRMAATASTVLIPLLTGCVLAIWPVR
jgi:hypothetical protein